MSLFNLGDLAKGTLNNLKSVFGFSDDTDIFGTGGGSEDVSNHLKDLDRIISKPTDRRELLRELEKMATSAVLDQILTIYADDIAGGQVQGQGDLWVTSEDSGIEEEGNQLIQEKGLAENFWSTAFFTSLYGDEFYPLEADSDGIENIDYHSHPMIFRRFQERSQLLGWLINFEDGEGTGGEVLSSGKRKVTLDPPWEVAHIKAGTAANQKFKKKGPVEGGYGKSVLEQKIADYKKMNLMENSMVLTRYAKSRRPMILWVSVEGIQSKEKQKAFFNSMKNRLRFNQSFKQSGGGEFESIAEMFSVSEPVILPSKSGKEKVIKQDLSENPEVKSIIDVEYIRDRFFGTVKIPSAFLGLEDKSPSNLSESILTNMSIRYARTISRRQAEILQGIKRIIRIHFAHKDQIIDPGDINIHTTVVSTAEDKSRADVAKSLVSTFQQIGQLFDRTIPVDYDQEAFARHIIDQLGLPGLSAQDLFSEKELKKKDKALLETAQRKLNPRAKEYDKKAPLPEQAMKEQFESGKSIEIETETE